MLFVFLYTCGGTIDQYNNKEKEFQQTEKKKGKINLDKRNDK